MFTLCTLVLLASSAYSAPASLLQRRAVDQSRNMIKKLDVEIEEIIDNSTNLKFKQTNLVRKNNELLKDNLADDYEELYDEDYFNPIINIRFKRADEENVTRDVVEGGNSTNKRQGKEENGNTMIQKNTVEKRNTSVDNKTNVLKKTRRVKSNRSLRKSNRRRNRRRKLRLKKNLS